jgi:hypothetical protein
MELRDFVLWFSTAGAGLAAWWLINNVMILSNLSPLGKRLAAYGIAAGLALAAWGIGIAMAYTPAPVGWRVWIEEGFSVGTSAFALSQLLHGLTALRRAR